MEAYFSGKFGAKTLLRSYSVRPRAQTTRLQSQVSDSRDASTPETVERPGPASQGGATPYVRLRHTRSSLLATGRRCIPDPTAIQALPAASSFPVASSVQSPDGSQVGMRTRSAALPLAAVIAYR